MWRAWYADGSVYSGETEEDWAEIPEVGCLIVECDGEVLYGHDVYFWRGGRIEAAFPSGPIPYRGIKLGKWAEKDVWVKAMQDATGRTPLTVRTR